MHPAGCLPRPASRLPQGRRKPHEPERIAAHFQDRGRSRASLPCGRGSRRTTQRPHSRRMWPRPAGHLPAIASTICHRQERDGGDAELADQSSPSIGTVRPRQPPSSTTMATCRRAPARSPARARKPAPNELARMGAFAGAFGRLHYLFGQLHSGRRAAGYPQHVVVGQQTGDQRLRVAGVPAEPQGVLAQRDSSRTVAGNRMLELRASRTRRPLLRTRSSIPAPSRLFCRQVRHQATREIMLAGPSRRRRAPGERRPPLGVRFRLGRLPDLAVRGSRRERVGWRQAALCRVGGVTHLA